MDALKIFYCAHCAAVEGLSDRNGHRQRVMGDGKSGRWGGAQSNGERCECDLDLKMFLHSDLLKLCLKRNLEITNFFPDTIVFLDENNYHYELMG